MRESILRLGGEMTYVLAKNRDQAIAIAQMPDAEAHVALAQMWAEHRVAEASKAVSTQATTPAAPARRVTKAPDPIRPVGGGSTAVTVSEENMSYREWADRRNKHERARRGLQ